MTARRLFRFSGSVRMRGMGSIVLGNLSDVTDYGAVSGSSSDWPGVYNSTNAAGNAGGISALINTDRTWVDNMDYGSGTYGFAAANPVNSMDYGSVA
mgnify:FL=1